MTSDRRFEQDLPTLLAELAPGTRPDYRDDIVGQTARMPQRAAWTFPGRWLPMPVGAVRPVGALATHWRFLGVLALLLLALAVGVALVAGSRPRVPPPFGPAGNGVVVYERGGNIFIADPVTGVARAVVTDTQTDLRPVFSLDGTHIVFERVEAGGSRLVVTRADGTHPVVITPGLVTGLDTYLGAPAQYTFSPDGTEVAFWSTGAGTLSIAKADGSGLRLLSLPMNVKAASYLPPDGSKLVVTASTNGGPDGIFAIDATTGTQTGTIVAPALGVGVDYVRVSPDGSRLAYVAAGSTTVDTQSTYRVHVVNVDGSNNVELPRPPLAVFQDAPAWSNDGTRLAITRGYANANQDMAIAVVPPDGSGTGHDSAHKLTGCCDTLLQWSPDDTSILVMPELVTTQSPTQLILIDPSTLVKQGGALDRFDPARLAADARQVNAPNARLGPGPPAGSDA